MKRYIFPCSNIPYPYILVKRIEKNPSWRKYSQNLVSWMQEHQLATREKLWANTYLS